MAIANFFDRAATAASNILQDFDTGSFQKILNEQHIGVAFDSQAVRTSEGRIAIELAVNLLSRLYPNISIEGLDSTANSFVESYATQSKEINPDISINTCEDINHCIIVGESTAKAKKTFYIGSKGWICKLSRHKPVESGNSHNPFGAAASACFGVANIFRSIFSDQLSNGIPDDEINISLLDYKDNGLNPEFGPVKIEDWLFVGCGAVGNGLIWTLSQIEELSGQVYIIDHDEVELTNLQRYVLMKQKHIGSIKVDVAKDYFKHSKLEVIASPLKWSDYLSKTQDFKNKHIAVSVDSAEDRIAVQASLPGYIVNAWTQIGDLGVSRHRFNDESACLACLYLPFQKQPNEDEIIAQSLRLSSSIKEVRRLLYQNVGVDRNFLSQVAKAFDMPVDELLSFEGQPLRTFYQKAVCGGIIFNFASEETSSMALVPMAFQSVLAGIILAGEVVAYTTGARNKHIPVISTFDLLQPLAPYRNTERKKDNSGRCICQDKDYLTVFTEKWNSV